MHVSEINKTTTCNENQLEVLDNPTAKMVAASDVAFAPVLALVFFSSAWAGRSECRDEPISAAESLYCNGTLT